MATSFYTVGSNVLAAVKAALDASNQPAVSRVGVVPGEIAWDNCETCGQLALSVLRVYLSDNFPLEALQTPQGQCSAAWVCADFTLQLIRCAPSPSSTGAGPSMAQLDASAHTIIDDASIALSTAACTLQGMVDTWTIVDYVVRQQIVVGPTGACVGSQLDFAVAVTRPSP